MQRHRAISTNRGLTVIELLIVIALLAILAAIIFILLGRARLICYRLQCASNLRQLSTSFSLYANDWYSYWPCPGGLVGDRTYWAQSGSGGLTRYVKQRGVNSIWCCPLLDKWTGKYPARSYSMNSYLREPSDIEYPSCVSFIKGVNTSKLHVPSRTILLFEGIPFSSGYQDKIYSEDQICYIYRCANWSWARGYSNIPINTIAPGHPWHGQFNNYLYCDGHVAARQPGRRIAPLLSTYKEMYEWYVDKARFEAIYQKYWSRTVPVE